MATTTATTNIVSPTPASDKSQYFDAPIMHIKTEGENSGFAAPAPGQSVPSPAIAAAQATDEKDKSGSGIGRVRSLLTKKRSVKKGSHPDPTLDDTSAIQKPHIASTTTVKDPAIRATDFAQSQDFANENPSMPRPEPAASLVAPSMPEPQPSTATDSTEPQLSRRYASPVQPDVAPKSPSLPPAETKSILAPSTRSTTAARTTGARDAAERPRASRTTSRSAPGSHRGRQSMAGESDIDTDSAADFSSEEEDEADEAGYMSPVSHNRRRGQHGRSRTEDLRSRRSSLPAHSVRSVRDRDMDRASVGTGLKRSGTAMSRRSKAVSMISTSGGVFASGAGTIGPDALPGADDSAVYRARATEAARALSVKQSKKITKEELKEGKTLSKILNQEGKTEKQNLKIVMKELAQLQSAQKKAIKEEMRTHTAYSKASKVAHAAELAFMEAQRKLQVAQAGANAAQESLNSARAHGEMITSRVQEKNREVEMLRAQKAADVREREVKMATLKGKTK